MKLHTLLVIGLMLAMGIRLQAQETTASAEYRLRVPTAEEYIDAIPEIWEKRNEFNFGSADIDVDRHLTSLLIDEFRQRYFVHADAATLSDAYEQLNRGINLWSNYVPLLDVVDWNIEIVQRYLSIRPIEFPDSGVLRFERYHINIEKYDFDSNSEYEWLMYVQREDGSSHFTDYWIAVRDINSASGYQITKAPVPFTDTNFWPAQDNSAWAGLGIPHFQDVNADGIVEWITSTNTVEPSSDPQGSWHTYYVLGWNDNRWNIITAQVVENENGEPEIRTLPLMTHIRYVDQASTGWTFENIDHDEALELSWYQEHSDEFFNCKRIEQSIYDWDGQYYLRSQHSNRFQFSPGCLPRIVFNFVTQMREQARSIAHQIHSQAALQPTPSLSNDVRLSYDLTLAFNRVQRALADSDVDVAANEIEQMLIASRHQNPDNTYLIPLSRYYYALALEALNRPDEALAEYVAIYEAAPESAWGMLAALHLERIE